MQNLKQTKIKLSVIFTIVVFLIAFILKIAYFWVKFINIKIVEEREFEQS